MEFTYEYAINNLPSIGSFIGNGKIGIYNNIGDNIDTESVYISRDVSFKNGHLQPNVIETFQPFSIIPFDFTNQTNISQNTLRRLDMNTAISSSDHTITNNGNTIDISSSIYCVRHLPFCTMQTLHMKPRGNIDEFEVFHEVYTKDNMIDIIYENPIRYVGRKHIYQFVGTGRTIDGVNVSFCTAYIFKHPANVTITPHGLGFNNFTTKKNEQFNAFGVQGAIQGDDIQVSMLTAIMTSDDFDDPRSEAMRITLSALSSTYTNQDPDTFIRTKHIDAWSKLWISRLRILPDSDVPVFENQNIFRTNKLINAAFYNIYSCCRESFNMDSNPNSISVLDVDGTLLYHADLWLVPLLLLAKPDMARAFIEYRIVNIQSAIQLAAAYGFKGAKMPFVDDIVGYKNNLYYTTSSYVHIFNTALVAINTWNYYRVSRDQDWLLNKGYTLLKSIANFLTDFITYDEDTDTYSIDNVVGLNDKVSEQGNSFTIALVKLALKYAIEASYELRYEPVELWNSCYNELSLTFFNANLANVVKLDKDIDTTPTSTYKVLETLIPFCPSYWEILRTGNVALFEESLKANLMFYKDRIEVAYENKPTNVALLALLAGIGMQTDTTLRSTFEYYLAQFTNNTVYGPWDFMKVDVPYTQGSSYTNLTRNSLSSNALYILILVQGLLQMRLVGGVAETRFYYEDMKIVNSLSASLPQGWSLLTATNFGGTNNMKSADVRQILTSTATGDFSAVTP